MAHDNSIASKVEAWMVTAIAAADSGDEIADVGLFEGTMEQAATGQAKELLRNRVPVAKVVCFQASAEVLSAGDQQVGSEYVVYIGVKNDRGKGTPRCGDGEAKGVHWCRALIQHALHDVQPGVSDDYYASEVCRLVGWNTVWQSATDWIIAMRFFVPEVPKAA